MLAAVRQLGQRASSVFPLLMDHWRSVDTYNSDSFFERLRKDYVFISNHVDWKNRDLRVGLGGIICGVLAYLKFRNGLVGIVSGSLTYLVLKKIRREEPTEDKKITLKLADLDSILAAPDKALFGANRTIVRMEQSEVYFRWKDDAIRNNIYPLFQRFLQNSDQLQDFLCDLTQDLISHPVRNPNGKIYEQEAIEDWLTQASIDFPPERLAAMTPERRAEALLTFCPSRSCHLTSDMLVYDFDYHRRVANAMKPLFDQQIDEQFRQGLLNYRSAMIANCESLRREVVSRLATKYSDGVISEIEFFEACRKCREHYNIPQ